MATLVLGTVGTLLGGPVGGAIGTLAGRAIDRAVLAPEGRRGPRLGDLAVQTSAYGAELPRLFGTTRVAGTVIWATDLREERHGSGSAKAGTKTTSYSYSASFAVALSARPIRGVARIWADGNLLRGQAGDWKADTGFRLYLGTEDQDADPLIAAAEGGGAPAHRGLAYAVFEDLALAGFGNRIPSLSFEVEADAAPVPLAAIAAELSNGLIAGADGPALGGFAAAGDSVRGALETLARAWPMPLADDGARLRLADPAVAAIPLAALGAGAEGKSGPARVRERLDAGALPDAVTLSYVEPQRDYQPGMQAARADGIGRREQRIDLPVALDAGAARALAEAALARAWTARERATARVGWAHAAARAGTRATIGGDGPWRVAGWTLERMALELALVRDGDAAPPPTAAEAGRATSAPDVAAGATVLHLLDLPALDDAPAAAPIVALAAAGTGAGWRRAAASLSLDGGASWAAAGDTAPPATMGSTAGVLPPGPASLFDRRSTLDVTLLNPAMALTGADDAQLAAGANLALVGDELVQFGEAQQVGAVTWRLRHWLRGRRGTEWAIAGHQTGERFVLVERATLLALPVPLAAIGGELRVSALGPGDAGLAAEAELRVVARAVRPPAPVRLSARREADGTVGISWVRRSRAGWAWLDGGDAPLAEDRERYRLRLMPAGATPRVVETTEPRFTYTPAMQAADGAADASALAAEVVQLGTSAASETAARGQWSWQEQQT